MIAIVKPSGISGTVQAPASKSSMQRGCAAALLAEGRSIIHNPGHSNDNKAAIDIIKRLGAKLKLENDELMVESKGISPVTDEINCGESGLSIRMFTPIIALSEKTITITGEGSLLTRPMDFFDEILPLLNVKVQSNKGKLPIRIKGPLQPKNIEIDGSLSSQFLTGLLMAYSSALSHSAPHDHGDSEVIIRVKNLKSKPYVDLTLEVMKKFGLTLPENRNYEEFVFHRQPSQNPPFDSGKEYFVEGDWSGGAFLLVAGAIAGPVTIRGLDMMSTQADRAIMEVLEKALAPFANEAKAIKIRPAKLRAFEFDATDCPDLFPPLVALAAYCQGETKIQGVGRLTHKESNRAVSLQQEFQKMGVTIDVHNDEMIIKGGGELKGARVHSHNDHRIAMACAVAALKSGGETIIEEAEAVKKSYPEFFDNLIELGADVSLNPKIQFHE